MKILHIHPTLAVGGIESLLSTLAGEQARMGHDVSVCSIYAPDEQSVCWHHLHPAIHKITLGKKSKGFSIWIPFRIARLIRKGGYDVVHLHGNIHYFALAVWLNHKRSKFIYTVHNEADKECSSCWEKYMLPIKRCMFQHKMMTPVIISHSAMASFERLYHMPCQVVVNGINLPKTADVPRKKNTFLHAARITVQKNQVILCEAFLQLMNQGQDISLTIAGSIQNDSIMNRLTSYLSDKIQYIGASDQIFTLMAEADAFCLSSLWEGLPISLLEAMSLGCIPVCTPVGGITEVIRDGENGFLSRSTSLEDYKEALLRFLNTSEEEKEVIRQHARETAKQYEINQTYQQYLTIYQA